MSGDYDKGPDHYALRARKEGYPARSVYKLEEIQAKFHVIPKRGRLLDIGAAPGSWTLYALKVLKGEGSITSVDLDPLSVRNLPRNVTFLQGDITNDEVKAAVGERAPYDLVMSDAAPRTSGNRIVDGGRSYQLVLQVLDLASHLLGRGGNLVVKIFQGGDEGEILQRIRSEYRIAKILKPKASRKVSFETYCIGLGRRNGWGAEEAPDRR